MRRTIVAAIGAAAAVVAAAPAQATFPGANGKLVVQRPAGNQFDLYTLSPDGSDERRILGTRRYEEEARWSPDGQRLAFASSPPSGFPTEIRTVDALGGDAQRVTAFGSVSTAPSWAPDGARLAFFTLKDFKPPSPDRPPPPAELYSIGTDGSGPQRLTRDRQIQTDPVYSPDGQTIAYDQWRAVKGRPGVYDMALMLSDADGSNPRHLTRFSGRRDTFNASWSPDGGLIAFEVASRRPGDKERQSDLAVITPDGTGERRLTSTRSLETSPVWSPDGTQIAFTGDRHQRQGRRERNGRRFELYAMQADGSGVRRITHNRVADVSPDWQPLLSAP